jgi:hypothetical protein
MESNRILVEWKGLLCTISSSVPAGSIMKTNSPKFHLLIHHQILVLHLLEVWVQWKSRKSNLSFKETEQKKKNKELRMHSLKK